MKKKRHLFLYICLICFLLTGCQSGTDYPSEYPETAAATKESIHWPTYPERSTISDGSLVMVDYSNVSQGYVGARLLSKSTKKIKVQIWKENTEKTEQYNYDLSVLEYVSLPISSGSGSYIIKILENSEGTNYYIKASQTIQVQLEDDKLPYLYPNQTVNYTPKSEVINLSFELVQNDTDDLTRLYHLYNYVIENVVYDDEKAEKVKDIYLLPDLDGTIKTNKGICFDYAAVLAAMCRVQNIPAKVIVGYTDIEYHAWVEVYLEKEGWINPKIYFKENDWSLVDPTFDSNGSNYEGPYDPVKNY